MADGRTRLQARTAALARDGIIFSNLESAKLVTTLSERKASEAWAAPPFLQAGSKFVVLNY